MKTITINEMDKYTGIDQLELNTPYLFYGLSMKGGAFFMTGCIAKPEEWEIRNAKETKKSEPKARIRFDGYMEHSDEHKVTHVLKLEYGNS